MKENNKLICQICGKECKDLRGLSIHIGKIHAFDKKTYYDLYLKQDTNEGICHTCQERECRFISINKGYADICSDITCINTKIKNTHIRKYGKFFNNRDKAKDTCVEKYGVEWYSQTAQYLIDIKEISQEKYGVDHYTQAESVKETNKQTCLSIYGVEHASQSSIIKEKTVKRNQEKYGVDHPMQLKETQKKSQDTCMNKYGVNHYSQTDKYKVQCIKTSREKYGYDSWNQSPEIKIRQAQSTFDKHGSYSYFQTQEFQDYMIKYCLQNFGVEHPAQNKDIMKKMQETTLKNHGVDNYFKHPDFYNNYLKDNPNRFFGGFSKVSQELFWKIYEQLPEDLQKECYFAELNKERFLSVNGNYFLYDFCILDKKIIIEFQGDYWHKNPQTYEYNLKNLSVWLKDEFKKEIAEDNGFKVFYVWESDYNNDKDNIIKEFLDYII